MIIATTFLNFVNAIAHLLSKSETFKNKPIESFQQLSRIIILVIFGILIVAELMGINPGKILTGLGALTVVIMLVFKDTILGFVASIQVRMITAAENYHSKLILRQFKMNQESSIQLMS